jgi:hypothetical protein
MAMVITDQGVPSYNKQGQQAYQGMAQLSDDQALYRHMVSSTRHPPACPRRGQCKPDLGHSSRQAEVVHQQAKYGQSQVCRVQVMLWQEGKVHTHLTYRWLLQQ